MNSDSIFKGCDVLLMNRSDIEKNERYTRFPMYVKFTKKAYGNIADIPMDISRHEITLFPTYGFLNKYLKANRDKFVSWEIVYDQDVINFHNKLLFGGDK